MGEVHKMPRNKLIQIRKDTYDNWNSVNPVLADGEPGYDKINKILKIGDGNSTYSSLIGLGGGSAYNSIVGVEWNSSSSSPELRRIDQYGNTVTLPYYNWVSYFDNHPIYGGMIRVELNSSGQVVATGNGRGDGLTLTNNYIMVQIPRVYYRYYRCDASGTENTTGPYERMLISPYPVEGFVLHDAFYARGHTSAPSDYTYVGAYTGLISSSKLLSTSGVTSTVSQTMDTFETAAVTNGTGFGILDLHTLSLLKMLFVIEYATFNSQLVLGYGNVGSSAQLNTGSTNANLAGNGTYGTTANQTSGMCWRGIENFWGNIWQFTIGFNGYTDKYRIINPDGSGTYSATLAAGSYIEHTTPTPIWYNNAQGGALSGTAANGYSYGYIKNFLYTTQTKGLFIPSLLGGSDATYIPDYLYSVNPTNQPTIWLHGSNWYYGLSAGAFSVNLHDPVMDVASSICARLTFI